MYKPECPACGVYNALTDDNCWKCKRPITPEEKAAFLVRQEQDKREKEAESLKREQLVAMSVSERADYERAEAIATGDWSRLSEDSVTYLGKSIIVTTSHVLGSGRPFREIDIISVEIVFGMNVFKEIFKSIRDLVGGRSQTVEKLMRQSREMALAELRKEAVRVGADAVIAVDLDYVEMGDRDGMVLLVANGTAVAIDNSL